MNTAVKPQQSVLPKAARNSSVELLRLFSLFGITLCHIIGSGDDFTGLNRYVTVAVNTFFNAGTGVICFMLITGYYGLKLSAARFGKAYSIIYACSLAHLAYTLIFKDPELMFIAKSFIPVVSQKWWYASCYIFTLLLSPFLNMIIERLNKKEFFCLISACIALFYVIPTFLYFDIMNDKGKGLVSMITVYFIGAYIRKYPIKLNGKKLTVILLMLMAVTLAGNMIGTAVLKEACWPFSRDCTVTTLSIAVTEFLLALSCSYTLKAVNFVCAKTFYMFLLANVTQRNYIPVDGYTQSALFLPICIANAVITICLGFIISLVLQYAAKLIQLILGLIEKLFHKIFNSEPVKNIKNKIINIIKTETD